MFKVLNRLPVVSQSYGLVRAGMRSCETSDPVEALKCSAVRLAKYCAPPHVLMPLRCGIFAAQLWLWLESLGDIYNISHGSSNSRLVGGNYIKEKSRS